MRFIIIILLFTAFPNNASNLSNQKCEERFDFVLFQIRQNLWPKSTFIMYSKHGYSLLFEGIGNNKYKFKHSILSYKNFELINERVHCEYDIFNIKEADRDKNKRPSISIDAYYNDASQGEGKHHSIYDSKQINGLYRFLHDQRDSVIKHWKFGEQKEGYGYGTEAIMEFPDPNYIYNYVENLHYSDRAWPRN